MITVSTEYMELIYQDNTKVNANITYSALDVTAKSKARVNVSDKQSFSEPNQTLNDILKKKNVSTLEHNNWRLNGTTKLFPLNPDGEWGWWSLVQSDINGLFLNNPKAIYEWSENHTSIGITLKFLEPVKEAILRWYDARGQQISSYTLTNNDLTKTTYSIENGVENYQKLELEIIKVLPKHYSKLGEIDFGIEFIWNDEIIDFEVEESLDSKLSTISSNQVVITLNNLNQKFNKYEPNNEIRFLQETQKLKIDTNVVVKNVEENVSLGTFYLTSWDSPSQYTTKFVANDLLMKLKGTYTKSKFYINATVETILIDLFQACNLYSLDGSPQFIISENVKNVTLTGYVPIVDYRTALQYITFACGAVVKSGRDGKLYIERIQELSIAETIDGTKKALSQDREGIKYSGVSISQYTYTLASETTELFNGELSGDTVITFGGPATEISITGSYTSYKAYANSIEIIGASGTIVVKGKVYDIYENKVSKLLEDTTVGITKHVLELSGLYLVGKKETAEYLVGYLLNELQKSITNEFQWLGNPALEVGDYVNLEVQEGVFRKAIVSKNKFSYNGALKEISEVQL